MKRGITLFTFLTALVACSPDADENRIIGELASDRIELTAEVSEPIIEIAVKEGESVTAGQLLLAQDDGRAKARLVEADAAMLQLQARLDELIRGPRSEQITAARANSEGASQEFEFRESELQRISEIHARGLASADQLDKAGAALDAAQAGLKLRLAQLQELLAGTTIEELTQAEQAVRQATAQRDRLQIDLERHALRAPVDGVLDSRLFELGERPGPGQPVAVLLAGTQPYARVYIPEPIRVRVRPGLQARIFVDGIDQPLDGRVRWVASESTFTPYFALTEHDRNRLSYVAKIDVVEPRERLPDGIPLQVELLFEPDDE